MKEKSISLVAFFLGVFSFFSLTPAQQTLDQADVRFYDNAVPSQSDTSGALVNNPVYREFMQILPAPGTIDGFSTLNSSVNYGGNYRNGSRNSSGILNKIYAQWYCSTSQAGSYIVYYHVNSGSAPNNAYVKLWRAGENTPADTFRLNMLNCLTSDYPTAYSSWYPMSILSLPAADSALTVEIGLDNQSGTALKCDANMLLRSRKNGPDIEFGARRFTRVITNGTDTLLRHNVYSDRAPLGFGDVIYQYNGYCDRTLTIYNLGTQPLIISGFQSPSSRFSLASSLPITVEAGKKKDIILRFKPLGEEMTFDTVAFVNNDAGEPLAKLPVIGSGVSYNFILNANLSGTEPHWNALGFDATFSTSGNSWASSTPSPYVYPIIGGNLNSVVNTSADNSVSCQYTFKLPDSLAGYYNIEYSGPANSSNAAQQAVIDVITPGFVNPVPALADTQRVTGINLRTITPTNIWTRIGGSSTFQLKGQGTTKIILKNPSQGSDYLRADLLRLKKIPVAATVSTGIDPQRLLDFGQVSIYDTARQRQQNFRRPLLIKSTGEIQLTINSIRFVKGTLFRAANLPALPLNLQVIDGKFELKIDFLPQSTGTFDDSLVIVTNDPVNPTVYIKLTGSGVYNTTAVPPGSTAGNQPSDYQLMQNYPNPFNPQTAIRYALPERAVVNLAVYNQLGQKVAELVNSEKDAGYHIAEWNASSVASGIYFYQLKAGRYTATRKLVVLK